MGILNTALALSFAHPSRDGRRGNKGKRRAGRKTYASLGAIFKGLEEVSLEEEGLLDRPEEVQTWLQFGTRIARLHSGAYDG